MLLDDILAGLSCPKAHGVFRKRPNVTHLCWRDECIRRGSDDAMFYYDHNATFELYAYAPDDASEASVEEQLDAAALEWGKTDRDWYESEQLFVTIYDFSYSEKE